VSLIVLCFHLFDKWELSEMVKSACTYLYGYNHWIILTGLRLCFSLLIAEILRHIPLLKTVYYPGTDRKV